MRRSGAFCTSDTTHKTQFYVSMVRNFTVFLHQRHGLIYGRRAKVSHDPDKRTCFTLGRIQRTTGPRWSAFKWASNSYTLFVATINLVQNKCNGNIQGPISSTLLGGFADGQTSVLFVTSLNPSQLMRKSAPDWLISCFVGCLRAPRVFHRSEAERHLPWLGPGVQGPAERELSCWRDICWPNY